MTTKVLLTTIGAPWQVNLRFFWCPNPTFIFRWCSCVSWYLYWRL